MGRPPPRATSALSLLPYTALCRTGNWIESRKAVFVIESTMRSGMGAAETVPFGDRAAAERFAAEHGGRIVGFDEVPRDYVLGFAPPSESEQRSEEHTSEIPSLMSISYADLCWKKKNRQTIK